MVTAQLRYVAKKIHNIVVKTQSLCPFTKLVKSILNPFQRETCQLYELFVRENFLKISFQFI